MCRTKVCYEQFWTACLLLGYYIPTHTLALYRCTCVSYPRKLSTQLQYDFQHISQRKLNPKEIITKSKTSRRNAVTYGPSCIFICIQYIWMCACMCRVIEKYFLLIYWICIVLLLTNLYEYMYMYIHICTCTKYQYYMIQYSMHFFVLFETSKCSIFNETVYFYRISLNQRKLKRKPTKENAKEKKNNMRTTIIIIITILIMIIIMIYV